jgi:transcriptional antiterminator RfaH
MDAIRTCEERQHAAGLAELRSLRHGDNVIVTDGPFAGVEGLVALVSRERVIVLMQLLGRETRVELRPSEVKRAA